MKRSAVLLAAALVAGTLAAFAADAPYKVVDGNQVDEKTLEGWRTWRAAACERCHGRNQEGMVGPSLVESLKTMTKEQFATVVLKGRVDKGMPNFDGSKMVSENIDNLYAYLKGRSDGAIKPGHVKAIPQ
jgi:mono/diheme cytochrome c family protein